MGIEPFDIVRQKDHEIMDFKYTISYSSPASLLYLQSICFLGTTLLSVAAEPPE